MSNYKLIPFNVDKHQSIILSLWDVSLSGSSTSRYNWLYNQNPYGQAKTVLAQNTKGEIVGCASLYPNMLHVEGEKIIIWTANDFAVRPEDRVFGPAVLLQRALVELSKEDKLGFTFAFPNKASSGVIKRVGYEKIGRAKLWSRPLLSREKISVKIKNNVLTTLISFLVDNCLKGFDNIYSFIKKEEYSHRILDSCDENFDLLWEKSKNNYKITIVRSSDYLNWRYTNHNTEHYSFFCAFDIRNELLGYIVFFIKDGISKISDIFCNELDMNFEVLLIDFCKKMRKQGVRSISVSLLENKQMEKRLKKLFFFERKSERVYFTGKYIHHFRKHILTRDSWYIFDGDMDI